MLCSYQVAPLTIKKHFASNCLQGVPWIYDTFHLVCQANVSDGPTTAMCKIYQKWLQSASLFIKLEPHPMCKSSPNQNQGYFSTSTPPSNEHINICCGITTLVCSQYHICLATRNKKSLPSWIGRDFIIENLMWHFKFKKDLIYLVH